MVPQVEARRTQAFGNIPATAQRTLNAGVLTLRGEIIFAGKPAFEDMMKSALKVKNFQQKRLCARLDNKPMEFPSFRQDILQP